MGKIKISSPVLCSRSVWKFSIFILPTVPTIPAQCLPVKVVLALIFISTRRKDNCTSQVCKLFLIVTISHRTALPSQTNECNMCLSLDHFVPKEPFATPNFCQWDTDIAICRTFPICFKKRGVSRKIHEKESKQW